MHIRRTARHYQAHDVKQAQCLKLCPAEHSVSRSQLEPQMAGRCAKLAGDRQQARGAARAAPGSASVPRALTRRRLCCCIRRRAADRRPGCEQQVGATVWRERHAVRLLLWLAITMRYDPHSDRGKNQNTGSLAAGHSTTQQAGMVPPGMQLCSVSRAPGGHVRSHGPRLAAGTVQRLTPLGAAMQAARPRRSRPRGAAQGVWACGRVRVWPAQHCLLHGKLLDTGRPAQTDRRAQRCPCQALTKPDLFMF